MLDRLFYTMVFSFTTIGVLSTVLFFLSLIMNKNICGEVIYNIFCFLVGVADSVMRKLCLKE